MRSDLVSLKPGEMCSRYRTEIVNKCQTKIDDQSCKVTFSGIPRQECVPKQSKRCSIEYDIVPETLYKEECHVSVQHVCEEFVPVPVPVHVAYPVDQPLPVVVGPTPTPQPLFTVSARGKREAGADPEADPEADAKAGWIEQ